MMVGHGLTMKHHDTLQFRHGVTSAWIVAIILGVQRASGAARFRQDFGLEISDHDLETLQLHCSLAWTMSSLTLPGEPKDKFESGWVAGFL